YDAVQLMPPEPLEEARPFMHGANGLGVRPIQHAAAVAAHVDEPDFPQYTKVLRNGRLLQVQTVHDFTYRPLLKREEVKDVAPTRFGDRIKNIRSCGSARHEVIIHSHTGICQAVILPLILAHRLQG